jgi:hypothetical protein
MTTEQTKADNVITMAYLMVSLQSILKLAGWFL